ncbi:putative oxidoreductase ORF5 in fasciation locus [Variibacter gotjawalensis]|uniref:Putative oxidoreductase ORF5 in fasciation locus n=1 Tax=Variibacter gotjawalensis TaxID=1333996 RepID=A0A0S3PT00_9BRAD|nr:FAD-binding oxidoreductase [Variibacter gotjawalensis]NIK49393.1 FAD/FMN-containing dehydrogenase [Variibacter gotjawalensis]RZS51245.1 FAD/FMN-containing dehydrogenase [Variibacter gotjawalensis]BAT59078.1 putative oxidoreductase ORF5 in fasciation locus [Variibacter gotjawalensis]
MPSFFSRHKKGVSLAAIVVALAGVYGFRKAQYYAADPVGEKDCGPLTVPATGTQTQGTAPSAVKPLEGVTWSQLGGTINDVSCLNRAEIFGVVEVKNESDIGKVIAFAREHNLTVTAAGVRHAMGGHAFRKGGIVLDMRKFNAVRVNADAKTMTVQSGAAWHDIQNILHPRFAVKAMQSTDIFTVGGSISVNAHGMDHQAGAMARSIKSMRVMMADGTIEAISRDKNRELFDLVVGGYGLFGVIIDATLEIVDNAVYQTGRRMLDYKDFPATFEREIAPNKNIALMYGHLSTAPSSFLREMLIYTYTKSDDANAVRKDLGEVSGIKMRRLVFNLSKKGGFFQEMKWFSEKHIEHRMENCTVTRTQAIGSGEACLVNRNDPMHDSVPYLRNALKNDTDILHEYFVPRDKLVPFIDAMRDVLLANKTNLLNASVRVVDQEDNFLTYAPQPSFSVVLYINQTTDDEGNAKMRKVTQELIDLTQRFGGRYFLPYQLYASPQQLQAAYPQVHDFFAAKRKYDPNGMFRNTFSEKYAAAVEK